MDSKKTHTTNPLMLKKQAKQAEPSSQFSSFTQNDSATLNSTSLEFAPGSAVTENTLQSDLNTTSRPTQGTSYSSARQFNLRPSTNPVSDFRRRRSYKGVANPTNTPRRRPIDNTNLEPRVAAVNRPAAPAPERVQPSPAQHSPKTAPKLDAIEIQNLGVQVNDNNTPSSDITVDAKNSKAKKSHKKILAFFVGLLLVAAVAAIVVFVLMQIFPHHYSGDEPNEAIVDNSSVSDDTPKDTKQENDGPKDDTSVAPEPHDIATPPKLIDNAVEVSIVGFADSATPDLGHKIVKVSLSNKSDMVQSIKISLAAVDEDGKILGVSNLYYEGLNPGETNELEAFTSTSLSDAQLAGAYYKIRSASVHQTKIAPSEGTE